MISNFMRIRLAEHPTSNIQKKRAPRWALDVECFPSSHFLHVHGDFHAMRAAAGDDAADRTHVRIITAKRDRDVLLGGQQIVRRIKIHPADIGTKNREPGVARVRADKPLLARRRARAQVAADITRRQTQRTQAGDGEMREILADAAALFQNFFKRRRHRGGRGIEFEIGKNPAVQIGPSERRLAMARCAKSWQTPRRFSKTSSSGVATVVAVGSNLKSEKIRRFKLATAVSSGVFAAKLCRA